MTKHHLVHVAGWNNSIQELVKAIGEMRYDALAEFMQLLSEEFDRQADADEARGRNKLANELKIIADNVSSAKFGLDIAWCICEPYEMGTKQTATPEVIPTNESSDQGFLRNCFIKGKEGDENIFIVRRDDTIIVQLDGYAVVPLDEYEAMRVLASKLPETKLPEVGESSYAWTVIGILPDAIPEPMLVVHHVIDKHMRIILLLSEWEEQYK